MLVPLLFIKTVLVIGGVAPTVHAAVDPDGVPYPNDIAVLRHHDAQAQLISYENKESNDYLFRKSLSPTARLASEIVSRIRAVENAKWRLAATSENASQESFPGEKFLLARPRIGTTDLFKVVKKMPKGSLLHAHLTAMLPADIIFQTIMNTPGIMISAQNDLASDYNRNWTAITFSHSNSTSGNVSSSSIWTTAYPNNTQIPITQAADDFPGGRVAFLAFLKDKVTLDAQDAKQDELGVDEIWRKFQSIFSTIGSAWSYEPVVRQFLQSLFGALADDGIQWVEIRNGGATGIVHEGQSVNDPDPDFWYRLVVEEIAKFKATDKGKDFWGVRFIWSVARGKSRDKIIADMKFCIQQKQKWPSLISGYDLVAQEDLGRPLSDLAPELIWFSSNVETLNLTIPYFFHAGETLGDGNSTDDNLFDAAIFGTRRIGHGFSLYKHPTLMDEYKKRDIMVEVCLISNEALRLNADVLHHPLPAMIAHGVSTALSNDDPAIEGQDDAGLSYDFYEAVQGFDQLELAGLGALAQNSVRYSNFEDQNTTQWLADIAAGPNGNGIKAMHLQEWNRKWEEFCSWVVQEFGAVYNVTS